MDFNATIHDLRTVLSVMLGSAQMLGKEELSPTARRRVAVIESQAHRMTALLERSIDGHQVALCDQVDVRALIRSVVAECDAVFEHRHIQLTVQGDVPLPKIQGDAGALHRVMLNLLRNAVDAMPHGGAILIRVGTELRPPGSPRAVWIEIGDTGPGIPDDLMTRVFEPGVTTKARTQGAGLGLAICRQIVWAHRGQLDLRSKTGQGTIARVTLPIKASMNAHRHIAAGAPQRLLDADRKSVDARS
jgi:signal transduction histidine kinase